MNGKPCFLQQCATALDTRNTHIGILWAPTVQIYIQSFSIFLFPLFYCHYGWVTLLSSLAPPQPVISCFLLVNINAGLMCTPQLFALEDLTAHIFGHHAHFLSPHTSSPEALSFSWSAGEKWQTKALMFLPSQGNVFCDFPRRTEVWVLEHIGHTGTCDSTLFRYRPSMLVYCILLPEMSMHDMDRIW